MLGLEWSLVRRLVEGTALLFVRGMTGLLVACILLAACNSASSPSATSGNAITTILHAGSPTQPLTGADSVMFVTENDTGAVVKSATIATSDSAVWTTPVSDSVWYNALVFLHSGAFTITGCGSRAGIWVSHSLLAITHTWIVSVQNMSISSRGYVLIVNGQSGTMLYGAGQTC